MSHNRTRYCWFNWVRWRSTKCLTFIKSAFYRYYSAWKCYHNTPPLFDWVPGLNRKRVCSLLSYDSVWCTQTCRHYDSFQAGIGKPTVYSINNKAISVNLHCKWGCRFCWSWSFYLHKTHITSFPYLIIGDKKIWFPKSYCVICSIIKRERIPSAIKTVNCGHIVYSQFWRKCNCCWI